MFEHCLYSKYFYIIALQYFLNNYVPKQQGSAPKAMAALIVFRLLAVWCNLLYIDHMSHWYLEQAERILPIRRIRKLFRAPDTPGRPLALKEFFI